jgi:hypothetical protein
MLRQDISSLEDKVRESSLKIESLLRKEKNLEGELKIYSEKVLVEKFGGG